MKPTWLSILLLVLVLAGCNGKQESETSSQSNAPPSTGQTTSGADNQAASGSMAADPAAASAVNQEQNTTESTPDKSAANYPREMALAEKSGCLTCHKIDSKLVGPAWKDVSQRYKDQPNAKSFLITKVKEGGKGNWTAITGGIPMPPNAPRVSDEDIEKLVTFILSL